MNAPRQVTLARLAELGLRPDTSLGQHFLVDDNLLGVIERLAALRADDVALEIGAGVGTLTARLAERCAHVHAVEIDARLEPALTRTLQGFDNVTVHWGDAMRTDLTGFEPPATAFVANLPYHVAAPLVLDSIGDLPSVQRWCVLVQREIAERLTAVPGLRSTAHPAFSARSRSSPQAGTPSRAASSCPCRTSTRHSSRSHAGPDGASSQPTGRRSSLPCARRSRTAGRRSPTP